MVRAFFAMPNVITRWLNRGDGFGPVRELGRRRHVILPVLVVIAGCAIVPRSRVDECQKLTQSLRADNARLKDRVLALQVQNRDYAERAVDDARRLAVQDEAIERLEHSVQAYQDDRTRLEAAYKQIVSNLGASETDGAVPRSDRGLRETTGSTAPRPVSRAAGDSDDDNPR
jgi:hypothetical protein